MVISKQIEPEWKLRAVMEYLGGNVSFNKIAEKYGVCFLCFVYLAGALQIGIIASRSNKSITASGGMICPPPLDSFIYVPLLVLFDRIYYPYSF